MGWIQQLGWKLFMDRNNIFYSSYVLTHFCVRKDKLLVDKLVGFLTLLKTLWRF